MKHIALASVLAMAVLIAVSAYVQHGLHVRPGITCLTTGMFAAIASASCFILFIHFAIESNTGIAFCPVLALPAFAMLLLPSFGIVIAWGDSALSNLGHGMDCVLGLWSSPPEAGAGLIDSALWAFGAAVLEFTGLSVIIVLVVFAAFLVMVAIGLSADALELKTWSVAAGALAVAGATVAFARYSTGIVAILAAPLIVVLYFARTACPELFSRDSHFSP